MVRGAGLTQTGQVLSPATIRSLACEAGILAHDPRLRHRPPGRGPHPAPVHRPPAQSGPAPRQGLHLSRLAGYTLPGAWCHVHHHAWWSRGDPTSFLNGAALRPRHHTLVHDRDLTAT